MQVKTLSHEDVNRMEDECRMAQSHLEEAGKIVCSVQGQVASQIWNRLTTLSNYVADAIHGMYRLRPETPTEQTGD